MKILIVEDDNVSRHLLRHIVESQPDYEVIEASNGKDAWTLLQRGLQPDLCLLDIHMPEMDGIELLRRIRGDTHRKDTKVILCSSINERATIAQAAALSINYYILKPYAKQLILEQIGKVAKHLESHAELGSAAATRERLGISLGTYSAMLKLLAEDIVKAVQAMRETLMAEDHKLTTGKLYRLKGASLNLGVTSVFSLICEVETALEAINPVAPGQPVVAESAGRKTYTLSAPHSQVVVKKLTELEKEAQRLLASSNA